MLAGDPKQLDAVTLSPYAANMGMKESLLEFYFKLPCYGKDTISGKFDPKLIMQLTKNYRSHKSILDIPNELFYNGSLESMASKGNCL